ncbi:probable multidrug resistance-associated protein lethal(2)03659 isoform X2 [Euwallacea similis]|uniref:probable multidrug resistance-associated protein lethal(2)03659 isoform X2 n=1 Tax=Euwallacea similis TaxID=1736056 RepID=UPI00344DCEBC
MENLKEAEERKRKARNPYVNSSFLARITFVWTFPLFYKGYKRGLKGEDVFQHLKEHDSELLGEKLEKEWAEELKKKNPSLWRAYARMFGVDMMLYGLLVLGFELIRLTLPLALGKLLEYFEPHSKMPLNHARLYAGAIGLITLVQINLIHNSTFHIFHIGMRMRVASVGLVYRKALRLSKSALAETTIGQMVNLISNDVSRYETCVMNVHNIWIGPVQLLILVFLLLSYAGWTGLMGIGVLLCVIPLQIWMGKKTSQYRLRTAIKSDERIRLMNEIINGMQVIKMYTWEKPFNKLVQTVRRLEVKQIQKNSVLKAIHTSFNVFLTKTLIYICVLVYVLSGNTLNAQYVFGLSLFYELMRQCLSQTFAQGISGIAEAIISTQRIRQFLLYEELPPPSSSIKASTQFTGIDLENVSTKWMQSSSDYSLKNVDFNVSKGELATIIGKVGSGKSTLLHVILKELSPINGSVTVNGIISYASQEPWLFAGNVKQNILFGSEYDSIKYEEVIRVSALERDLKLFPHGDRTLIGEKGISLSGGQRARINLARAIYKDADIYLLDDPLSAVDAHVGKQIFKGCIEGYLKDKCVVLVTHQLQFLKDCKKIYLINNGEVQLSGSYEEIQNSDGEEFTALLGELKRAEEEAVAEDLKRRRTMSAKIENEDNIKIDSAAQQEAKVEGKVTWKIYKTYFLAGGNIFKLLCLGLIFIVSQFLANGVDYFLSLWVNMEQMKIERNITGNSTIIDDLYTSTERFWFSFMSEKFCLQMYTGLVIVVAPLTIARGILFFKSCINASVTLQNSMFSQILYAPMRFFYFNPSGRILNRFSKDMNQVDEYLPVVLSDTVQVGFMMAANIVVVAIVIPFILLPTVIILGIFYMIRTIFLATSIDIKRFEALTRSPVYSHLAASLQGLTTIRAFTAQNLVTREFDNYQNAYNSAYFMFLGANRTFGYWLDLHTAIFVTLVTFSFLIFPQQNFSGGSVGLAITQAINLAGWFQFGIRQWSEMENTMTCVERVKEYAEVVPEADLRRNEPVKSWPERGGIKFVDLRLRYGKDNPFVLEKLNFEIKPKEKIGIVGRTGAGKSSIIVALFRLAKTEGEIYIDDVEIQTISLNRLRSSISIIPQEPVLFSGTLRKNLDPFDEFDDQALWNTLEEVELKSAISELPRGLESKMSEGGSNFSVGQRQLVCLARAIVRNNKILVLDEATANVDPHTDSLIQSTIRKRFADCTVLTIAHRLHTIMDSDKMELSMLWSSKLGKEWRLI